MKRVLSLGRAFNPDADQFAIRDEKTDKVESFNGSSVWSNSADFRADYEAAKGKELGRYLAIIPDQYKTACPHCKGTGKGANTYPVRPCPDCYGSGKY